MLSKRLYLFTRTYRANGLTCKASGGADPFNSSKQKQACNASIALTGDAFSHICGISQMRNIFARVRMICISARVRTCELIRRPCE